MIRHARHDLWLRGKKDLDHLINSKSNMYPESILTDTFASPFCALHYGKLYVVEKVLEGCFKEARPSVIHFNMG